MKKIFISMTAMASLGAGYTAIAEEPQIDTICDVSKFDDDQKETVEALCNKVRFELLESKLEALRNDAKLLGLDVTPPNEGTTTFSGNNKSYAEILAVMSAARAGGEMGASICQQARGRTIYFGLPNEYRQDAQLHQQYARRIDSLIHKISRSKTTIDRINTTLPTPPPDSIPSSGTVGTTESQPFMAGGSNPKSVSGFLGSAAVLSSEIIAGANILNDLTKLFRSDVTITGVDAEVPARAFDYAIKSGIMSAVRHQAGCRISAPEQDITLGNPLRGKLDQLYLALDQLSASQNLLSQNTAMKLGQASVSAPSKIEELKSAYSELNKNATTLLETSTAAVEKVWEDLTEAPTLADGTVTNLPSHLDRIISAHKAAQDPTAVFLDASEVKTAASQVHSKGLFRTDRLHFTGSTIVGYELLDRQGFTIGSGMFDASSAELIQDRTGFKSSHGRITRAPQPVAPTYHMPTYRYQQSAPARPVYPQHGYAPRHQYTSPTPAGPVHYKDARSYETGR